MKRFLVVASVAVFFVVVGAPPAGAIMTGACTANVNGVDVAPLPVDDAAAAIKVPEGGTVTWSVSSPSAVRSRNLVMSFAGVDVTIDRGTSTGQDGGSRGDTVAIDDYAWMGAGLYQVAGVGRLGDGTTCTGAVLIEVGGNPLGTAGGIVGVILTVLGTAGIIVGAIRQGGGRLVRDLVELIELQGPEGIRELLGDPPSAGGVATGGASGGGTPTTAEGGDPGGNAPPTADPATATPPAGDPFGGAPPPTATTTTPTPPADAATSAPPGDAPTSAPTVADPATADPAAADPAAAVPAADPAETEAKPPPLPGMETVATVGTTATALAEATEKLNGHIDELPISDEEKEKLKETLATGTIKEKLDVVNEVVENIQHFEAMGTETVDKMNRWGINANGTNGLLWLQTMATAGGRLGQKAVDGIVTPVIEPIAKAAGEAGVEVDAEEVTHTLLPVKEFGEQAAKALFRGAKDSIGGDQILDQVGVYGPTDDEWRNIRTFK